MSTEEKILDLVKKADPQNPVDYVKDIVKGFAVEKLSSYIKDCKDCSNICHGQKSLPYGNPNATVMVIGECILEDQNDAPYIYPFEGSYANDVMQKIFAGLGVNKDELFIMNTVNCFPYKDLGPERIKRAPTVKERDACFTFIDYAIRTVEPVCIIALGGVAINAFTKQKEAVSKVRGQWLEYRGIPMMPTYHPNYFKEIEGKKDPELIELVKWDFFNDIKTAFEAVQDKYPNIPLLGEPYDEE